MIRLANNVKITNDVMLCKVTFNDPEGTTTSLALYDNDERHVIPLDEGRTYLCDKIDMTIEEVYPLTDLFKWARTYLEQQRIPWV